MTTPIGEPGFDALRAEPALFDGLPRSVQDALYEEIAVWELRWRLKLVPRPSASIPQMETLKFFNTAEVAAILGKTGPKIRALCRARKLLALKLGKEWVIPEQSLRALQTQHRWTRNLVPDYHQPVTLDQVRRLRRRLGFTQTRFAALIGVHPITVAVWEGGGKLMTATTDRLLRILAQQGPEALGPKPRRRLGSTRRRRGEGT
jgi:DNA-binding transcriptional regulator YiaG